MVAFVLAYSFTEPIDVDSDEDGDEDEDEGEKDDQKNLPMMVPMADILNHIAKNNAHLSFEQDELQMLATMDISKVL